MKHRDCQIFIKCDGKVLDEHDVQVEDTVISCYIASEAGKEFTLWINNPSSTDISADISVDGRPFPYPSFLSAHQEDTALTYRDNASEIRALMFSDISVTDDESAASILPDASHLGLVQVHICRVQIGKDVPYEPPADVAKNFGPLHEKTKKGGMHCVSFGAVTEIPITTNSMAVLIDKVSSPYVTFNFRYRPQAILQAQGILQPVVAEPPLANLASDISVQRDAPGCAPLEDSTPRSTRRRPAGTIGAEGPRKRPRHGGASSSVSSPLETTTTRHASPVVESKPLVLKDEDVDDEDELNALRAQMRAMQGRMNVLEGRRSHTGRTPVVKRETSPVKAAKFDGDVIDLTGD
ncbi:uncharacterized protein B0H18DRAFT_981897 [Fomitopsis serialis]|uniref:uncharacterized protein n=1 Tax=Fomitopsis serialis TaxID=139415 RepID=UPI0020088849|nr:uncharacterized protein B0H18DRAFT_981897 [Neoantrodia serialis]KAH9933758.1 hypothetical protein B0H18DRAFT_981897 [Neoantrodia serialis]